MGVLISMRVKKTVRFFFDPYVTNSRLNFSSGVSKSSILRGLLLILSSMV